MDLSSHGIVALVRTDNKYLLLEDSRNLMRGFWAPPHGRCKENDKSEQDAIIREVREETGLIVQPVRKITTVPAATKVKTVSFWIVETDENQKIILDTSESSQYGWFTIQEALRLKLYPGTKKFFEDTLDNQFDLS